MCCSPNNCRFHINDKQTCCYFWSILIEDNPIKPRCCITLHWMKNKVDLEIDACFEKSSNIRGNSIFFVKICFRVVCLNYCPMLSRSRSRPPLRSWAGDLRYLFGEQTVSHCCLFLLYQNRSEKPDF